MRINTNINAIVSANQMNKNNDAVGSSLKKLSTGLRITKAGDDAAGLAISENMRSQIRGLEQANRNVQDGISAVQTAEGALREVININQRMREITIEASNDTYSQEDRDKINLELKSLSEEILNIANDTKFNEVELLNGTYTSLTLQVGANHETFDLELPNLKTIQEDLSNFLESNPITDNKSGNDVLVAIDTAINSVSEEITKLGATQNRLEYTSSNLNTYTENLTSSESRIRDVDVAKEMIKLTKSNIINQASQLMLSQSKQNPQNVIQLLN